MTEQVTFTGELSIGRAEELVTSLQRALQGQQHLTVNLSAVELIDTAAAQILLAAQQQALQTATTLTFSCSPAVDARLRSIGIHL